MTDNYNKAYQQSYIDSVAALANGKRREQVISDLIRKGWSSEMAAQIVSRAQQVKTAEFRKAGLKLFGIGIALLVLGVVITAASYSLAAGGGTYIVTIGLFLSGAVNTLKGLFRMVVG